MDEILKFEKKVPLTFSLLRKAVPAWVQCRPLHIDILSVESIIDIAIDIGSTSD